MNRRSKLAKPIVAVALVLILCLAGLGVGYAHWQGTLNIEGTAETGTFMMGWYYASNSDPCGQVSIDQVWTGTGPVTAGQDIGCTTVTYEDYVCHGIPPKYEDPVPHYRTMVVTINEGYPGYYVDVEVEYHNCGTIPVIITAEVVDADPELDVAYINELGEKVHPCEAGASSLKVWLKQPDGGDGVLPSNDPDYDGPYQFTVTLTYEQAQ